MKTVKTHTHAPFCCYDYEVVNPPCFPSFSGVATGTESSNDMNVENNHTAETEREQTTDGNETITIQTTLGDEGLFTSLAKTRLKYLSNIVFGPS